MLGSNDQDLVRQGAAILYGLGAEVIGYRTGDLDATLLSSHSLLDVRQLAALVAVAAPGKYALALRALAVDSDSTVRTLLAYRLHEARSRAPARAAATPDGSTMSEDRESGSRAVLAEALEVLKEDLRHAVRRAAAGLDS